MRVVHAWLRQPLADRLCQNYVVIGTAAIVDDLDDNLASGMSGSQNDLSFRIFAGGNSLLRRFFDSVVHRVADNVHQRVADAVHDGLIHFCIGAHKLQRCRAVQLLSHVADNTLHLLEGRGNWHHAQRHRNILQIVG